jgi:hypothetical protein
MHQNRKDILQDNGLHGARAGCKIDPVQGFLNGRGSSAQPDFRPQSFIKNSLLPLIFAAAFFCLKRVSQNLKIL